MLNVVGNIMQSADILSTIAELAVALAVFSAIVVMLNSNPIRQWDDTDRLNLRLLIQVSAFTIFFALLPSILVVSLNESEVWKYGLWAYGLLHILDVSSFLFKMTKETPNVFRNAAVAGVLIAVTQLVIAWAGSSAAQETMYLGTLLWHLCITFMAFILLLYGVRKTR